jgi:hypothetical protein
MAEFQRRWGKKSSVHSLENEVAQVAEVLNEGGKFSGHSLENEVAQVAEGLPIEGPPLDRPPTTEAELRRLMDYLSDPAAFAQWFERLMEQADPAEEVVPW